MFLSLKKDFENVLVPVLEKKKKKSYFHWAKVLIYMNL